MIADVKKVFAWERHWGVANLLAEPRAPVWGMLIGSPASAGGCSLVAADKEEARLDKEREMVKVELRERTLCRRWMGDQVHLKEKELSEPAEGWWWTGKAEGFTERCWKRRR